MNNERSYNYNTSVIKKVDFTVLTNNEVLSMSSIDKKGIDESDLYIQGQPNKNGLLDKRLGVSDWSYSCATCHYHMNYCDGHFGHVVLSNVLYNITFFDLVCSILNIYCSQCSALLWNGTREELNNFLKNKKNDEIIKMLKELLKNVKHCHVCNTPVGKIIGETKNGKIEISIERKFNEKINIEKKTIKQIYNILKNIRESESSILGISCHPKDLMYEYLIIPPVPIRPSINGDFTDASSQEDQLTVRLSKIIKINNKTFLQKEKEKENDSLIKYSKDRIELLQLETATYINNESIKLPKAYMQNNNTVLKSLVSRFKGGKKGRIRGNLMGKRVNQYGRTVISPDPLLKTNEVYIPVVIAKNLTYPEIVTPYNIEKLTLRVQNGSNTYPGANCVTTIKNGYYKTIILDKNIVELQYGDEVHRHLEDGDIILINRQPTLHKYGIMAHYIKVVDDENMNTIRINPSVCKGYGADFDGDEINVFTVQSILTDMELQYLTDVKHNLISCKDSLPIVSPVFDSILGPYNLTKFEKKIDNDLAIDLLVSTDIENIKNFDKNKSYSGNEFFNFLIPENINLSSSKIEIKKSSIVRGFVDGSVIKAGEPNTLIQEIWNKYGADHALSFIDNITKMSINYNLVDGFTVNINDYKISDEIYSNIKQLLKTEKLKIFTAITEMENNKSILDNDEFEKNITTDLNNIRSKLSNYIIDNLPEDNNNIIMLKSKAKGKSENIVQMIGCVGQQDFEGKRMHKSYNNRTLPYFHQNDDGMSARGFIESPLTRGMNLEEFTIQTSVSRNALITQAIKTADTGYIQRKLVKLSEDFMIKYDGFVRNSSDTILQYLYGDSGFETTKFKNYNFQLLNKSDDEIEKEYKFNDAELKKIKFTKKENDDYYLKIISNRDKLRKIKLKSSLNHCLIDKTVEKPKNDIDFLIVVDVNKIIYEELLSKEDEKNKNEIVDPNYILEKIENIIKIDVTLLLTYNKDSEHNKNENSFKKADNKLSKKIFKYILMDCLSLKKCIIEYKFSKQNIDNITNLIIKKYNSALIEPGEMVGILAAQTLGEPATQMTISNFHMAGISGGGTTGVPRLKEIYTPSSNMKSPIMIIYFDEKHNKRLDYLNKISLNIINTSINDLITNVSIYYDNKTNSKECDLMIKDNINEKNIFVVNNQTKNSCLSTIDNLNWIIRLEMDKEKMLSKEISLMEVINKISVEWENRFKDGKNNKKKQDKKILFGKILKIALLFNKENMIIHIRFNIINYNINTMVDFVQLFVQEIQIKGIKDIKNIIEKKPIKINSLTYGKKNEPIDDFEYILKTEGININDIYKIKGIDHNKLYINDIVKVVEIYGIEAGRTIIINELREAYRGKGENINYTHYTIPSDIITSSGKLISLDRFGLNTSKSNPLSKASFEMPVEILVNAGIYGQSDDMKSVSSRIIGGLCFLGGSNLVDIIIDKDFIENSEFTYNLEKYNSQKNAEELTNTLNNEFNDNVFIPNF